MFDQLVATLAGDYYTKLHAEMLAVVIKNGAAQGAFNSYIYIDGQSYGTTSTNRQFRIKRPSYAKILPQYQDEIQRLHTELKQIKGDIAAVRRIALAIKVECGIKDEMDILPDHIAKRPTKFDPEFDPDCLSSIRRLGYDKMVGIFCKWQFMQMIGAQ